MKGTFVRRGLVFRLPTQTLFKNLENILRWQCTMSQKMFGKI